MKDVNNMNKKIFAYIGVITTLGVSTLTGCNNNEFEYQYEENNLIVNGTIDYNSLSELKLVYIENEQAAWEGYYLVQHKYDRYIGNSYLDIETNKLIYKETEEYANFKITFLVENMIDYIFKYNFLKEEYTIEDIKKLKEQLLQDETVVDLKSSNQKKLIKAEQKNTN